MRRIGQIILDSWLWGRHAAQSDLNKGVFLVVFPKYHEYVYDDKKWDNFSQIMWNFVTLAATDDCEK